MAVSSMSDEYRAAWKAWSAQLDRLHRVLLDGEAIEPSQLKGLLGREARAKQVYDRAREELLGLGSGSADPPRDGSNPFR